MSQPLYGYPSYTTQVVSVPPPRSSTAHIVIAWVLAVLTGLYLLPWAVAATRGKRNTGSIVLINIFLGWTLAGWIAALVMACLNDDRPAALVIHQPVAPAPSYAPTYPALPPRFGSPGTAVDPYAQSAAAPTPTGSFDEPTRPLDLSQDPYGPRWR